MFLFSHEYWHLLIILFYRQCSHFVNVIFVPSVLYKFVFSKVRKLQIKAEIVSPTSSNFIYNDFGVIIIHGKNNDSEQFLIFVLIRQ